MERIDGEGVREGLGAGSECDEEEEDLDGFEEEDLEQEDGNESDYV